MFTFDGDPFAYINILLGIIGFAWLLLRSTTRWSEYPYEMKLLLFVTMSFIFALLETSAEQIINNDPVSFNSIVIFIVKAFLVFVLFRTRSTLYRTGERSEDTTSLALNDTDEPNRDIIA